MVSTQKDTVTQKDAGPEVQPDGAPAREAIVVDGVSKVFRPRKGTAVTALENMSLTVREGEIVSLIGPSGCGKSTLLMLVAGLGQPTAGTVHVRGERVTAPNPDVGVVFQKDLLFDWRTVLDNVLTPFVMRGQKPKQHAARAKELLAQVGLTGFEDRRPYELSGGMRQRVALCRGLIQDPDVLLLDEPFAALDALTREQMQLDLQKLVVGTRKTGVLVTHDIAEAVFLSDRIAVMSARPSRIVEIIDVDLPRPRTAEVRESAAFGALHGRVHNLFKQLGVFHG
jgi:NitT/TauT family transport system ATP-binding protein